MDTEQTRFWKGEFGKKYTERNTLSVEEWDAFYQNQYGTTKYQMFLDFIGHLPRSSRILEVGCNSGQQLRDLQRMGFENLYGVELQKNAVELAKHVTTCINIIEGNGFDLPFKDSYFDLIMTNGVLIHISPTDLRRFTSEIYRCTKKYIYGFEYFSPSLMEIPYRGNQGFLWKADYASLYCTSFPGLKILKKQLYPYLQEEQKGNTDCMFLLEKG